MKYLQVVILGDSLTWSMRMPYGRRYADRLEHYLTRQSDGTTVFDVAACGDGGNSAAEALARLNRDCIDYDPHIVVINVGGNDVAKEPDSKSFENNFRQLLDTAKAGTRALLVVETIPGIVQEKHCWKDSALSKQYGGLEKTLEEFSYRPMRHYLAENPEIMLHDRYKIYHKELFHDPAVAEKYILDDGIHLTAAGNDRFAGTLADLLVPKLPGCFFEEKISPGEWLRKAEDNEVFQYCLKELDAGNISAAVNEMPLARLLLQKTFSCARRAGVFAQDAASRKKADTAARLAGGMLSLQRALKPTFPMTFYESIEWGRAILEPIKHTRRAEKLLSIFAEIKFHP